MKRGKLLCDNSRVVDGEIVHYDIGLGVPALLLVVEDELMEYIGVFAALEHAFANKAIALYKRPRLERLSALGRRASAFSSPLIDTRVGYIQR